MATGKFDNVLLAPLMVLLVNVSVLVSVENVVPVDGTEIDEPPVELATESICFDVVDAANAAPLHNKMAMNKKRIDPP